VFVDFVADCVVATQTDLLRLLKNSGGVKNEDGGVNSAESGGVNLRDAILAEIKKTPGINTPTLSNKLSIALRTTQRYLKNLTEMNEIEFRGAPKNGGYYSLL
ncbi:MAG: winged helix-turn-helix domain-containing protein, partial [Fibrobacteraceae bacterium]|nr:winged helix-turn-helix domain-containing protein [Fibrobacteraceae bacterium]